MAQKGLYINLTKEDLRKDRREINLQNAEIEDFQIQNPQKDQNTFDRKLNDIMRDGMLQHDDHRNASMITFTWTDDEGLPRQKILKSRHF